MRLHLLFITISLLVVTASLKGQSYWQHLWSNKWSFSLSIVSGYADGTADVLRDKYSSSVFKNANEQFWNPSVSWVNKYKDWPTDTRAAFPGSKTWLVWMTDGWHLSKTIHLKSIQGAILTYNRPKHKRWWWLADFAIHSISFSAGWHLANKILTP